MNFSFFVNLVNNKWVDDGSLMLKERTSILVSDLKSERNNRDLYRSLNLSYVHRVAIDIHYGRKITSV